MVHNSCCSLICGKMEHALHGTQFMLQHDLWKDGAWCTICVSLAALPMERWNTIHNSCCSMTCGKMEHGTQFMLQSDLWKDGTCITWYTIHVAT